MNSYRMNNLKERGNQLLKIIDENIGEEIVSDENDFVAAKNLHTYRLFRKVYVDMGKLLSEQDEALHRMAEQISALEEVTKRLEEENRGRKRVLDELESIKYDPDKRV